MSSMYLLNPVSVGSRRHLPGALVSDPTTQALLQENGGVLWPTSDANVAAAAARADLAMKRGDVLSATALMLAGAAESLQSGGDVVVTVTASYVVPPGVSYVRVDTTEGDLTVTMPGGLGATCTVRKVSADGHTATLLNLDAVGRAPLAAAGDAATTKGNGVNAEVVS